MIDDVRQLRARIQDKEARYLEKKSSYDAAMSETEG